jgi:hypothetical protein
MAHRQRKCMKGKYKLIGRLEDTEITMGMHEVKSKKKEFE